MSRLFFYSLILKAVILTLGIFAHLGKAWAFALFIIVTSLSIFVDLLMVAVTASADNDIERDEQMREKQP